MVMAIVGLAIVVMGGCAGAEQSGMSREYMKAGDYDRAVEQAEQALSKQPDNPDYLDLLSDAQTAAADSHFEQARELMEAHKPAQAKAELDKALKYMPAHPGANNLLVEVDKAIRQGQEVAEKAREQGEPATQPATQQPAETVASVQPVASEQGKLTTPEPAPSAIVASKPAEAQKPALAAAAPVGTSGVRSGTPGAIANAPAAQPNAQPTEGSTYSQPRVADPRRRRPYSGRVIDLSSRGSVPQAAASSQPAEAAAPVAPRPVAGQPVSPAVAERPVAAPTESRVEPRKPLFKGALSRSDQRFRKIMAVMDGISIKLRDTDEDPLDADLEIVAGRFKSKPSDVPIGRPVKIRGVSGQQYVLVITAIIDKDETISFTIDRAD
jgi:hypothetical protein